MAPRLPEDVVFLLDKLENAGFEGYIVGGCVRDTLLGRVPKDWDITTSAAPWQVKGLFSHTIDTGIAHGTVTVVLNRVNYEITTYRIDGEYQDCRRPEEVVFTSHLEEDLLRRDFTMNAIAYHPKMGFRDPYGGQEDIKAQIIRGVGQSEKRFQEDALRMLRALRFAAQLGFAIEQETYAALVSNRALIQKISAERIREELEKLLLSPYLEKLPLLWESGLLCEISPVVSQALSERSETIVQQISLSPLDKIVRFSLLLQYCTPSEGAAFLKALKPDSHTLREVTAILENLSFVPDRTSYGIKKAAALLGIDRFRRLLNVQKLSNRNDYADQLASILEAVIQNKECITIADLAVSGNDIMAAGIPAGKAVGAALASLLDYVHRRPEENNLHLLLAYTKEHLVK